MQIGGERPLLGIRMINYMYLLVVGFIYTHIFIGTLKLWGWIHTYAHIHTHISVWWEFLYIDGLEQDGSNSSALATELLHSCTKPSIYWSSACVILTSESNQYMTFVCTDRCFFFHKHSRVKLPLMDNDDRVYNSLFPGCSQRWWGHLHRHHFTRVHFCGEAVYGRPIKRIVRKTHGMYCVLSPSCQLSCRYFTFILPRRTGLTFI